MSLIHTQPTRTYTQGNESSDFNVHWTLDLIPTFVTSAYIMTIHIHDKLQGNSICDFFCNIIYTFDVNKFWAILFLKELPAKTLVLSPINCLRHWPEYYCYIYNACLNKHPKTLLLFVLHKIVQVQC